MYRWKKCRIRSLSTPLRIVTENQVFSLLFRLELHWGSPFLGRLAKSIHLVHILGKIHILGSFSNNLPRGHTHCFFPWVLQLMVHTVWHTLVCKTFTCFPSFYNWGSTMSCCLLDLCPNPGMKILHCIEVFFFLYSDFQKKDLVVLVWCQLSQVSTAR